MDNITVFMLIIMGISIMQINIKNWLINKYLLETEATNNNIDVTLVNELGVCSNKRVQIRNYNSVTKSLLPNSGAAIL